MRGWFFIDTGLIVGIAVLLSSYVSIAYAKDCDEFNYAKKGLPEGFVLDKGCKKYSDSISQVMDFVRAKKLRRPKPSDVLAQCPFDVYGVEFFCPY